MQKHIIMRKISQFSKLANSLEFVFIRSEKELDEYYLVGDDFARLIFEHKHAYSLLVVHMYR